MTKGVVSPVFAGREAELAVLASAFDAAAGGTPQMVLVGGEAGCGKSRLAAEFTAQVSDRALVLAGGCLGLSAAALPYAPFTAALRQLVREQGAARVAALLPGQAAGELAALLPGLGAPPGGTDPETARARLFELVLALLESLAEHQPVVLIVEDVHWVDRATADLLNFLSHNLRQAAVLLVVTFRSDDLHRNPLLRPLLATLGRRSGITRLELPRLSRDEVAMQVAGILGRPSPAAVANAVFKRGGGIPLFTETLLNPDGTLTPGLPWLLRDLLLTTVQSLPEPTQRVLRAAAVGGTGTEHALLAAVTSLGEAALTAALRPAVDASVLVTDTVGYTFRHDLFREALLADMLPAERRQAHRAFAEALEADASPCSHGAVLVQLALHWRGAQADDRALAAAWQAAADTGGAFAYAQRLRMLEQVLDLWEHVPDAVGHTGTDRIGVLAFAADTARWAGEPERGLALVELALTETAQTVEDAEPRAALLRRRAGLRRELLLPGQLDDLEAALALATGTSRVRAQVLAQLCWALRREDRHEEVTRLAGELDTLAGQLADEELQAEALLLLAADDAHTGQDTAATLPTAVEKAAASGSGRLEVWAYLTASHVLEGQGRHEQAIRAGREGLARARQLGLGRQVAASVAGKLAESLMSAGRWDEALEIIDEILGLDQPPLGRVHPLLVRGHIAVSRGEVDTADRAISELHSLAAGMYAEAGYALPLARLEVDCRLATGDMAGALAAVRTLPADPGQADPRHRWALLATAMRACAEARVCGPPPRSADAETLRKELELRACAVAQLSPLHSAYAATFAAEAARADGCHDLAGWDEAAAAWEGLRQPYPAAYALLRAAGAAIAGADRDGSATRLERAAEFASQVAAEPLLQQVRQLARRARIQLAKPGMRDAATSATPFGLTARELEVLRLVAAGHGNREIGAELFIAPRTASVHVSNILAKLGVASRGEAAATAYRLHLFEATENLYHIPRSSGTGSSPCVNRSGRP